MLDELFIAVKFNEGIVLSLLGGTGSYFQGVRDGRLVKNWWNGFTELTLALVVGLVVLYLGEWKKVPLPLLYVAVLVLSNNCNESINLFRVLVKQTVLRLFKSQGVK